MQVTRRYETLPGPLVHKIDYDNNNPQFPILSTSQRVAVQPVCRRDVTERLLHDPRLHPPDAVSSSTSRPTDYASVKEDQRIFELNPSDKIVSLDYDSTVNAFIETIKQKVPAGTIPVFDDLTLEFREKPVDKYRTIQIYSKLTRAPRETGRIQDGQQLGLPDAAYRDPLQKSGLIANRGEVVLFPNTLAA